MDLFNDPRSVKASKLPDNSSIQRLVRHIQYPGMFVTRKAEFSASHVCRIADVSEAENRALYGDGANPNGHGHNYVLEVTVEGDPDPVTGMVINLKELKDILEEAVVAPMDHRFLNAEIEAFKQAIPTTENVALEIWRRLEAPLRNASARLVQVRLFETADLYVDVFPNDARERARQDSGAEHENSAARKDLAA